MGREGLSPRQEEILQFKARGESNKAIGKALKISTRTVQVHASALYARLGVRSAHQAVVEAAHRGLLNLNSLVSPDEIDALKKNLTWGQFEVMRQMVKEKGRLRLNRDIAEDKGISKRTIDGQLQKARNSIKAANKAKLAVIALAAVAAGIEIERRRRNNKT